MEMIDTSKERHNRQGDLEGLSSLSYVYTNQSISYSSTGMSGSVTGGGQGPGRHLVLY